MAGKERDTAIILIDCPDQKGIVHQVCDFVLTNNGNIIKLDQHVDYTDNLFFMRIEWDLSDFTIPSDKIKYSHCIHDILSRYESGEWDIEISVIISNHEKFAPLAKQHDIPFHHFPITKDTKQEQERKEIELMQKHHVDFVLLARYMQILSSQLIDAYPMKIINIHHSSLPAFAGANPYKAAYVRGVKFMGATAHYVTEDLDEGPIIAQDVIPISHRDSIADMKRKGKNIEKIVFANAIWSHLNHNVLIYKNKTVVFE